MTGLLRREQVVTAALMAVVLTFGFFATDAYMAAQSMRGMSFWRPVLPWDSLIVFAPGWVWIYLLYFPVCFLPLGFKGVRRDIGTFRRTAAGFAVQFVVALGFFWAVPSQMQRPEFAPEDFSRRVLSLFYEMDPGFNIFPSLHVANAAYVACLTGRLAGSARGGAVWAVCLLIAASTLFVKQHYLADLPAGLLLGAASYGLAFSKFFSKALGLRSVSDDWRAPSRPEP